MQLNVIWVFLFVFLANQVLGQGFLMGHFFKPGLKMGVEYHPPLDDFEMTRARMGLSIPVKSKLGLGIKFDKINLENILEPKKWSKIPGNLSKVFKPKAHQIFWNFNLYYNTFSGLSWNDIPVADPYRRDHLFGANTGLTGFHYLKKARILFYSANIGFLEDRHTVDEPRPTANALVGFAQVTGLHTVLYLGAYVAYADKRVVPVPVIGFDTRLAKGLRLNLTLPVQAKLTYRKKKNRYSAVVSLAGFAGGLQDPFIETLRSSIGHLYLKTGLQYNRKIGKRSKLVLDAGWAPWRKMAYGNSPDISPFESLGGPYVGATFYRTFGKALFDGSLGNFLN